MKKQKHGLWSNLIYMLKTVYKINKSIYFIKFFHILLNSINPFIPIIFIRLILNEITIGKDIKLVFVYVLLMAGLTFLINIGINVLDSYSRNQVEITVRELKNYLGKAVMSMSYSEAEQPRVRDFIELAQESSNFQQILEQVSIIITCLITIFGLFAIIITVQPIIFLFVALVVLFRLIADKKNRILWDEWRPRYAPMMRKSGYFTRVMKTIEFGKEVRINNLQDWIYDKYDENAGVYIKASKQHNKELQRNLIFSSVIAVLQECAVYIILAYKVVFQGMSIGNFSMYMTSVNSFANNVSSIVSAVSEVMKMSLFANDFRFCIELSNNKNTQSKYKISDINADNISFEFRNVSFKYPNTDRFILKNISLKLHNKQSLSIVGINGAGKTSLVKLLCRLYEPTEGEILVNGINIQQFHYEEYIKLIVAVFQDFKLFAFSVGDNVSFDVGIDKSRIKECMIKSGLEYKLKQLTFGLDTNISKEFDAEGIEFSGGEGQKLAIARALYKNSPVMILDEPTAALDPISEYDIYSRFNEITQDKMTIYISHRLSSCQFCDKIAVLNQGEIVQYGSHNELINDDGLYAQMWNMQAQYYVE